MTVRCARQVTLLRSGARGWEAFSLANFGPQDFPLKRQANQKPRIDRHLKCYSSVR
jgi:hypothetical protein